MMQLVALWYGHRRDITPELRAAIEQRFTRLPLLVHRPAARGRRRREVVLEREPPHHLPHARVPGRAGAARRHLRHHRRDRAGRHADRGRQRIEAWLDEKAAWGFSEWHSDVYYQEDIQALTAADRVRRDRPRPAGGGDARPVPLRPRRPPGAAATTGVTHGRSYMKDKSRATDQDVFGTAKLLFGTSDQPVSVRGPTPGATFLAAATRYRLPGGDPAGRHQPEDVRGPHAHGGAARPRRAVHADPPSAVPGVPYDDPDAIAFWWDRGALTAWQTVPDHAGHHRRARPVRDRAVPAVQAAGRHRRRRPGGGPAAGLQPALPDQRRAAHRGRHGDVAQPDAMLSSAQDYRPGCFGQQYHAWQATLDEDAVVFTTLPGNEPRPGEPLGRRRPLLVGHRGHAPPRPGGRRRRSTSTPRSFAAPGPGPLEAFVYLPFTHAYFPTERFDEVRQVGGWTLGRQGRRLRGPVVVAADAVAHPRPGGDVHQRAHPAVRPGGRGAGADNVWIVRGGRRRQWGSFDAFAAAVTGRAGDRTPGRWGRRAAGRVRRHVRLAVLGRAGVRDHRPAHGRRRRGGRCTARHRFVQPVRHHRVRLHDGRDRRGRRQPRGGHGAAPATPRCGAADPERPGQDGAVTDTLLAEVVATTEAVAATGHGRPRWRRWPSCSPGSTGTSCRSWWRSSPAPPPGAHRRRLAHGRGRRGARRRARR